MRIQIGARLLRRCALCRRHRPRRELRAEVLPHVPGQGAFAATVEPVVYRRRVCSDGCQ